VEESGDIRASGKELLKLEPANADHYLLLIETFRDRLSESEFDAAEAENLRTPVLEYVDRLKEKNPAGYAEVEYEMGRLYWNYYRDNSEQRRETILASKPYFENVLNTVDANGDGDFSADEIAAIETSGLSKAKIEQAEAYYNFALFTTAEGIAALRGDSEDKLKGRVKGKNIDNPIKEYWDVIVKFREVIKSDEGLSKIVKLNYMERISYAAVSYTHEFKQGALSAYDMAVFYRELNDEIGKIEVTPGSESETLKENTEANLIKLKANINAEYGTGTVV
jgi:hypothetical protein